MNATTDGARDPYARFWEQLAEARLRNPGTNFVVAPDEATQGSGVPPSYVYEANTMLARQGDMHRILPHTRAREDDSGVPGLRKLIFENGTHIPTEVRRINGAAQRDMPAGQRRSMVTPNHMISIAPVNLCPAGEPYPVTSGTPLWPDPQPTTATAGAGGYRSSSSIPASRRTSPPVIRCWQMCSCCRTSHSGCPLIQMG